MPSLKSLQGLEVVGPKGSALGRVLRVLCHPADPVVVGFEIQPPNVAMVVSRRPRYIALAGVRVASDHLEVDDPKDWSGDRAAKTLGIDWEQTVIWLGMPVVTESGSALGYVSDATFRLPDARIDRIGLTDGLTSDAAIGTRTVAGEVVTGFADGAVRVSDAAATAEFSGGLAAQAGKGAAVAKVVATDAAKRAADLGGSAVKAAAKSKAARSAWSVVRETGKAFKDGMKDDDAG